MAALKLLLVRHGQSQGNGEGRMEGWHSTALTDLGQQQAQRLGQYLAATRWPPTQIYCSPLLRATATLEAMVSGFVGASSDSEPADLLPQLATATVLREELKENNQGIFNGLTWAEACDRYPHPPGRNPGGGSTASSSICRSPVKPAPQRRSGVDHQPPLDFAADDCSADGVRSHLGSPHRPHRLV
jgi:broad specificity phosphatase PhoE